MNIKFPIAFLSNELVNKSKNFFYQNHLSSKQTFNILKNLFDFAKISSILSNCIILGLFLPNSCTLPFNKF
jgi:hypothetical protein